MLYEIIIILPYKIAESFELVQILRKSHSTEKREIEGK